jgi:hypothetical protein
MFVIRANEVARDYEVGHYAPDGEWYSHYAGKYDECRSECHYLNGGSSDTIWSAVIAAVDSIRELSPKETA